MRIILAIVFSVLLVPATSAQSHSDKEQVKEVLHHLFKGMEFGDSAMVRSVFTDDATLVSVFRNKNHEPVLRRDASIQQFLKAIGTPHPEPYHEETWNMNIMMDGDLAQVWCNYAFYVGKKFSHCGVDAFHFHNTANGWKIFHLSDTRRNSDCNVPQEVADKYK